MVRTIRVLVVDDSALMRRLISDMLASDPEIEVVGTARDGDDALAKIPRLTPDVVTLDIEMPGRDGLATLPEIMKRHALPVVMLSSLTQAGAEATLKALQLGAIDVIGKPSGAISMDIAEVGGEVIHKVKSAFASRQVRSVSVAPVPHTPRSGTPKRLGVVVIGASTGGPKALASLLPALPPNLGVPIVIVQHLGSVFTRALASHLQTSCGYPVREAEAGERLRAGTALLAPGGRHLKFASGGVVNLSDDATLHGVRPSIDVTMNSLVAIYGARIAGVLLTGMGRDGATGLKAIRDAGGRTIAQDEATSAVYGMPKVARELGAAERVLPLSRIGDAILDAVYGEDASRHPAPFSSSTSSAV